MIFVNSMSDLFHEGVPDEYISSGRRNNALAQLAHVPGADEAFRAAAGHAARASAGCREGAAHLVGRQRGGPEVRAAADADLQAAPAAVRFLSVEPLLEDLGKLPLKGIYWVIVGGESGPARDQ